MRNLERLNLRSRDLKVFLFGDDTIDCGREFQGWTTLYAKKCLSRLDLGMVVVMRIKCNHKKSEIIEFKSAETFVRPS